MGRSEHVVCIGVERIDGLASAESLIGGREPPGDGPTRPIGGQGGEQALHGGPHVEVFGIELEHRYPQRGTPRKAKDVAVCDQLMQANWRIGMVFGQQVVDDLTRRRAAGGTKALQQRNETRTRRLIEDGSVGVKIRLGRLVRIGASRAPEYPRWRCVQTGKGEIVWSRARARGAIWKNSNARVGRGLHRLRDRGHGSHQALSVGAARHLDGAPANAAAKFANQERKARSL